MWKKSYCLQLVCSKNKILVLYSNKDKNDLEKKDTVEFQCQYLPNASFIIVSSSSSSSSASSNGEKAYLDKEEKKIEEYIIYDIQKI